MRNPAVIIDNMYTSLNFVQIPLQVEHFSEDPANVITICIDKHNPIPACCQLSMSSKFLKYEKQK